jgi:hypothetical protein
MIRLAFGAKCGSARIKPSSASCFPVNKSGINNDPNATLPIPKLNLERNFRLLWLSPCSNISFSISAFGYRFLQIIQTYDHLHQCGTLRCDCLFIHWVFTHIQGLFGVFGIGFELCQLFLIVV